LGRTPAAVRPSNSMQGFLHQTSLLICKLIGERGKMFLLRRGVSCTPQPFLPAEEGRRKSDSWVHLSTAGVERCQERARSFVKRKGLYEEYVRRAYHVMELSQNGSEKPSQEEGLLFFPTKCFGMQRPPFQAPPLNCARGREGVEAPFLAVVTEESSSSSSLSERGRHNTSIKRGFQWIWYGQKFLPATSTPRWPSINLRREAIFAPRQETSPLFSSTLNGRRVTFGARGGDFQIIIGKGEGDPHFPHARTSNSTDFLPPRRNFICSSPPGPVSRLQPPTELDGVTNAGEKLHLGRRRPKAAAFTEMRAPSV